MPTPKRREDTRIKVVEKVVSDHGKRIKVLEDDRITINTELKTQTSMLQGLERGMGKPPNPLGETEAQKSGYGVLAFVARDFSTRQFNSKAMTIAKATCAVLAALVGGAISVLTILHYLGVLK